MSPAPLVQVQKTQTEDPPYKFRFALLSTNSHTRSEFEHSRLIVNIINTEDRPQATAVGTFLFFRTIIYRHEFDYVMQITASNEIISMTIMR